MVLLTLLTVDSELDELMQTLGDEQSQAKGKWAVCVSVCVFNVCNVWWALNFLLCLHRVLYLLEDQQILRFASPPLICSDKSINDNYKAEERLSSLCCATCDLCLQCGVTQLHVHALSLHRLTSSLDWSRQVSGIVAKQLKVKTSYNLKGTFNQVATVWNSETRQTNIYIFCNSTDVYFQDDSFFIQKHSKLTNLHYVCRRRLTHMDTDVYWQV